MISPVLLVFGAGANVGLSVVKKFASEGYKVAAVARTPKDDLKSAAHLVISADLSKDPVEPIFEQVQKELGTPSVVVYNAYALDFSVIGPATDPLVYPGSAFVADLTVNAAAPYTAASLFAALPPTGSPKLFVYTGNMQSTLVVPETVSLGAGKNAMAYVIETAAHAYGRQGGGEKGCWYFADERMADGSSVMAGLSGEASAEFYFGLVGKEQGPWNATFVKGEGYKKFEAERDREVKTVGELMEKAGFKMG